MSKAILLAIRDMPGFSEATGLLGGALSAALIAGAVAAFFGMISVLFYGLIDTIKYFFVWRKKPEVICTVKKLKDTTINYSLNEIKSRNFVYDVEVSFENKTHTLTYTKTMKKEKPCDIKEGDSFLVFADTKKHIAEDATAIKKTVKKSLILFAICALLILAFLILIKV